MLNQKDESSCKDRPHVKRKSILVFFLSILLAVFTIAVRAERRSGRVESSENGTATRTLLPRFVSSSVAALFDARQEETALVLAGNVFLLLSLLSLRRARRPVGHS